MREPRLRHLPLGQRVVLIWISETIAFALLTLLPGLSIAILSPAVLAFLAIGLLNALVRPLLVFVGIRPRLPTLGLLTLLVNASTVWLTHQFVPGFTLSGDWMLALIVVVMSGVNIAFSDLFAIDDDDSYYHHLVSQIINLSGAPREADRPGVVFLEIDGLSEPVLKRALEGGHMPTLKRWMETGSHRVVRWECDLPSQTSASQAGILLGDNFDIPAFRWYEKDKRKPMISNRPLDAAEIERRLSSGGGLLALNGASRTNLVSGDAPQAIFTFSTLTDVTRHSPQEFYPLFMGPYNAFRMALLFVWDILAELRAARFQRVHDVQPRVHRGGVYPLLRTTTTVLLRELNIYILIGDMYAGVPAVYATFVGYDEVAHHSGVERPDAIDVLHDLDRQFDRLERASKYAPRPYEFVILSDHGQSQGATFKQRYGLTLDQLVRSLVEVEDEVESVEGEDAAWGYLSAFLTDVLHDISHGSSNLLSRLLRRWLKHRTYVERELLAPYRRHLERQRALLEERLVEPAREHLERQRRMLESAVPGPARERLMRQREYIERLQLLPTRERFEEQRRHLEQVVLGPYRAYLEQLAASAEEDQPEVVVLASGNLGLIYFTHMDRRLSYEQIKASFPKMIPGLIQHEGVGFVLVRSDERGPMVLGARGIRYLSDDSIDGKDPLAHFGENAARHLCRVDSFPHVPDILVNSLYDPVMDEVAAFEELVGSHGGLGGDQMSPFLMFPSNWQIEEQCIVGASALHNQLRSWISPS